MLIIRRRRGESIWIGEQVEIRVLESNPHQVKLGIFAPKDVAVLRGEVRWTVEANRAASCGLTGELTAEAIAGLLASLRSEPAAPASTAGLDHPIHPKTP